MRGLHFFNLCGVLVLAAVCVLQWRVNRDLNLRTNQLDKTRIDQQTQIEEQVKQMEGQAADLDAFREHVQRASADLKVAESNLYVARHEVLLLTAQRDQLKEAIEDWYKAVEERDEQIRSASDQIQQLADDRNEVVTRFNELANKHNQAIEDLNTRTRAFNELVERYNTLAKDAK
jgi:chromosome segregation ATPase